VSAVQGGDRTFLYKKSGRPDFQPATQRGRKTQLIFDKLDFKNNRITTRLQQGDDTLYRLDMSYSEPPRKIRIGENFRLMIDLVSTPAPLAGDLRPAVDVQVLLSPEDQFSSSGHPLGDSPTRFTVGDLDRLTSTNGNGESLRQTVDVITDTAEARSVHCGYKVGVSWADDSHEFRILFRYRRHRDARKQADSEDKEKQNAMKTPDHSVSPVSKVPDRPWRDGTALVYFSEYSANLNQMIRAERGVDWSVDSWGREVGPGTLSVARPAGRWDDHNHYLWAQNQVYDFYSVSIREYVAARMRGELVGKLLVIPDTR
jgi:hypothetical protein